MNNSKGQITVFIIMSIVVLIVVGLGFALTSSYNSDNFNVQTISTNNFKSQVNIFKSYATSCFDSASVKTLWSLGLNGGYYENLDADGFTDQMWIPSNTITVLGSTIPDYRRLINFPSYDDLEKNYCAKLYVDFSECLMRWDQDIVNINIPFNIVDPASEYETISCDANLQGSDTVESIGSISNVFVSFNYPISLTAGELNSEISTFSSLINVSFSSYYNTIKSVVDADGEVTCNDYYYDIPGNEKTEKATLLNTFSNIYIKNSFLKIIDYSYYDTLEYSSSYEFLAGGIFRPEDHTCAY